MRKLEIIYIILCLVSLINSTCEPDEENNKIRNKKDCVDRSFSDDEISKQAYKCCYMMQKINDNTRKGKEHSCIYITENDYKNIKKLVKQYKDMDGIDDVKINCNSYYLIYALINLFFFLL